VLVVSDLPCAELTRAMLIKRQHTVPAFYLDNFVDDRGGCARTFWVFDKGGGEPRRQTPKDTTVERHFYSIKRPDSTWNDQLERSLGRFETIAGPIIRRLLEGGNARLADRDIAELAYFMGVLHVRVPRNIKAVSELMTEQLRWLLGEEAKAPDEFRKSWNRFRATEPEVDRVDFDAVLDLVQHLDERVTLEANPKVAFGLGMMQVHTIAEHLMNLHWCISVAPEGSFFVTSDAPVNIFNQVEPTHAIFGGGIALPQVQVFLPLSPSVGLSLDRYTTQNRRRASARFVQERNRRTTCAAERFLISPIRTCALERLVEEFAHTRAMPKVDREVIAHQMARYSHRSRAVRDEQAIVSVGPPRKDEDSQA